MRLSAVFRYLLLYIVVYRRDKVKLCNACINARMVCFCFCLRVVFFIWFSVGLPREHVLLKEFVFLRAGLKS